MQEMAFQGLYILKYPRLLDLPPTPAQLSRPGAVTDYSISIGLRSGLARCQ